MTALADYKAKRDFARTPEPEGAVGKSTGHGFVVQKHDATRLHWDFRLEIDGVLKSWAVTRGPSLNPDDKRLAVRTEDHPLSYATFEGTIPAGQYGGGTVMLWDHGSWEPVPGKQASDLEKGHLHFILHGERMRGEWLLIRIKGKPGEKRENWLLRKVADAEAGGSDDLVGRCVTSVATGRTMDEIAEGTAPAKPVATKRARPARRGKALAPLLPMPKFREPELCTLVDHVPTGNGWLHEMKYDGYRCLLAVSGGHATVFTRSGLDWTDKFPEIAAAGAELPVESALIDGEIVHLDDRGHPGFAALKDAISAGGKGLVLMAFDLIELDGKSIADAPLTERKTLLQPLLRGSPVIRYSDHVIGKGEALFEMLCRDGLEGVVSKRVDSPYRSGRGKSWLKVKCTHRQEFIVIGWSETSAAGRGFKSLLLAVNLTGKFRYAGKVGTGFDADRMEALRQRLDSLAIKTPPAEVPRAAARGAHWVKPELVAEIAFAEFTADGLVRHASFIGLRDDKPAADVVAETPAPVADIAGPAASAAPSSSSRVSSPDRLIFPEAGITKQQLADYYARLAPLMLPWAARRPISLVRCPQGRAKQCFFQKHDPGSFGKAVRHVPIEEHDGDTADYIYVEDAAGLIACVQMGTIEFHGWGSRIDALEQPDRMIFDLDPDPSVDFAAVRRAAIHLRDALADLGLATFPMLTGGKGVHVVAPLTPDADWPRVKDFAQRFATALAQAQPDRFTATMPKAKRRGRIFIDWLRNQRGATAVVPYSVRAREGAPVAAPVSWDELDTIDHANHWHLGDADALIERAAGATLRGWGTARQTLPDR